MRTALRSSRFIRLHTVLALTLVALLSVASTSARAAFLKGPYQQNVGSTGITIRWETSTAQNGVVDYGLTSAHGSRVTQSGLTTQHEIALTALMPDTLYYFRAISGADTSAVGIFHTAVQAGRPFRFLAYGDNRTNTAAHQSVIDEMLNSGYPGLLLNVGDLTATGSTADYQTFFNVEKEELFRTSVFPVLGNHDTGNIANYLSLFALPGNERWYSVRYGNISFHALDNYSGYTPGSAQYEWFVNELKADSSDAGVRHIVVVFHEPPYTTNTGHASNLTIRQYICPLLERFKVKLSFQGHNHCYEHSLVNGVHYVITGGGGAPLYSSWGASQPWTVYRETTYEFVRVDARGDTLEVTAIKPGGAIVETFQVIAEPSVTGVPDEWSRLDPQLKVEPNPAFQSIKVSFDLPRAGRAVLAVYDTAGQRVSVLTEGILVPGRQTYSLDVESLPAGVYFAVLKTDIDRRVAQFVVVR